MLAARVRQWGIRARDRVADAELPQSRAQVDAFVNENTDGLRLLWSLLRAASRGVDDFEGALADARHGHQALSAWLAEAEQPPTTLDCDGNASTQTCMRLTSDIAAYRSAQVLLARSIEAANEPLRLLVGYVGRAVEVALHLDQEVERRSLHAALQEYRKRIETIRRSTGEHNDLQAQWESRMGRRFSLPEIGQ
jgi:hypothetical protein